MMTQPFIPITPASASRNTHQQEQAFIERIQDELKEYYADELQEKLNQQGIKFIDVQPGIGDCLTLEIAFQGNLGQSLQAVRDRILKSGIPGVSLSNTPGHHCLYYTVAPLDANQDTSYSEYVLKLILINNQNSLSKALHDMPERWG
ncbi:MAG: hypothetical protein K2X66_03750 [Cyanobacteria bacterium]|nr:hypothetical protein [Cyanobacteriota bacterium]